ncbi:hypothetical protein CYG49_00610 [Candidatus Saccharibacteria bacterium]|nr:MAG: hypothetical protein CYG49_00610 [Candidatus Saccharibacteria bacterium]
MKVKGQNKLELKKQLFAERVHSIYPDLDLEQTFRGKPLLAIRVNTLVCNKQYDEPIEWAPSCYWPLQPREQLVRMEEVSRGEVFLQNASSFIPPTVLAPQAGESILDMCAAPGGKASHIAALAHNECLLSVNDNSKPRLIRMQQNFERLRVDVQQSTMQTVERLHRTYDPESFDKILLDAPCSGEGAIQWTSTKSFTYWSGAQIKRLQQQQKQALRSAWQLLKPGGTLVYSTCTIAPEENEAVIDWLLRTHEDADMLPIRIDTVERVPALQEWHERQFDARIAACVRIKPSERMEAFFVARIQKQPLNKQ